MARAFLRENDRYVALLEDVERAMIAGLMEQTRLILSPEVESTGDAFDDLLASMGVSLAAEDQSPAGHGGLEELDEADSEDLTDRDPALDRLLPTAHRGDDQIAAEFRRLTEEGLRQRKSANLDVSLERLVAADGERLELDGDQAAAFLMALTDVRLLLGERMGMRTEEDADALQEAMETIADDDPLGYAMALYDFLTWLQESLTHALMGPDDGPFASPRRGPVDEDDDETDDAP
ncbi:MAG TPA: DUF2017 domain-containing protein [Dermatophilaceae bacterium]|nr:DUF2017 domain-containing protein [Dermatophilaceae bacterium]